MSTATTANRFLLLAAFTAQTVATGCVYFGWAPLSSMLLSVGIFADQCPAIVNDPSMEDPQMKHREFKCNEQDAAVQNLYTITLAAHFTTSAFAGLMMDTLGPRLTSVLGQGFNIAGWSLISTVNSQSHAKVYAAFVLIGMGADTAFLPTLLVSRLFPRNPGLIITLLGAACSASFVVPSVLWLLLPVGDLSGCIWYVIFGPGLFLLVDALLMPVRHFKTNKIEENTQSLPQLPSVNEDDSFIPVTQRQACANQSELMNLNIQSSSHEEISGNTQSNFLFRTVLSQEYILIVVYFIGVSWVSSFYQQAHSRILAPEPQRFLGWMLPLSFIPCIFFGKCSDCMGILPVMLIVNTAGLLTYLCSLSQQPTAGYASVLFFMMYMSLFSSQVFIYIEKTFSTEHFGRLIGLVELTGGLFSLLCNPVYANAVENPDGNGIMRVQMLVIMLLLFEFLVLGRLLILKKRRFARTCRTRTSANSHQYEEP